MKNFLLIVFLFMTAGFGWYFYGEAISERVDIGEVLDTPFLFGKDALRVEDQPLDGAVEIKFASLSKAGFIVIQDDEQGPGRVIGTSELLEPGRVRGLRIPLTEDVDAGYVFVALYRDDSDGRFDIENDIPIRGPSLAPVQYRFLLIGSSDVAP